MKYCRDCGKKLKDEAEFCYSCGAPCIVEDEPAYMERRAGYRKMKSSEQKKAQSTGLASLIGSVILIIIMAALMLYVLMSPGRRTYAKVMEGRVSEARSLYETGVKNKSFEAFVLRCLIPRGANTIVDAYNAGEIGFQDADDRLKALAEFESPLNNALKAEEKLNDLHVSVLAWGQAQSYEQAGDYRKAMLAYRLVSEEDANYDATFAKAAEMEGLYKSEVITSVGAPQTEAEYQNAIAVLEEALTILPGDVTLTDKLSSVRQSFGTTIRANTIPLATEYISKGYYKQAIDLVNEALRYNEQDLELKTLLQTATKNYEDFARNQVSIYLGNKDITGAMSFLDRVRQDLPDSSVITQLYDTVSSASN